jgi:hypothetical protein
MFHRAHKISKKYLHTHRRMVTFVTIRYSINRVKKNSSTFLLKLFGLCCCLILFQPTLHNISREKNAYFKRRFEHRAAVDLICFDMTHSIVSVTLSLFLASRIFLCVVVYIWAAPERPLLNYRHSLGSARRSLTASRLALATFLWIRARAAVTSYSRDGLTWRNNNMRAWSINSSKISVYTSVSTRIHSLISFMNSF